jgi:hypothetical protein
MAVDGNGVLYIGGGLTGSQVLRETPVANGYSESVVVPSSSLAGAQILNLAVDQKGILYIGTNTSVIKVDFTVPPATARATGCFLGLRERDRKTCSTQTNRRLHPPRSTACQPTAQQFTRTSTPATTAFWFSTTTPIPRISSTAHALE